MDALTIGRFLIAALVVLLTPGSAVMAWLPAVSTEKQGRRLGFLTTLADVVALSIAIPALLGLWLFAAGVQIHGGVAAGLYGLCLLLAAAGMIKRGGVQPGRLKNPGSWAGGLLAVIFLAGLVAWRMYQARTLALPNWVDSAQHLLIVRKIMEYGGVPPNLEPYLPAPFIYHYGFHLIAALFSSLSGMPAAQGVLWFGQVLNALVAISVYRGAQAFAGHLPSTQLDAAAGAEMEASAATLEEERHARPFHAEVSRLVPILAALLVGFAFQMPAYYLTWGRYTMLTGLLLLGPMLAAVMEVRGQPARYGAWVRLVLLTAGVVLTHYFILLLAGLFLVVAGLPDAIRGLWQPARWFALARLAVLVGLGIALASPWLWWTWQDLRPAATVGVVNPLAQDEAAKQNTAEYLKYLVILIGPRRNHILMGMAAVGLLAASLRPRLYPLAGWAILIGLLSLPWGPRLGPFRPDHFSIVLFFPAAILLAELLAAGGMALGKLAGQPVGLGTLALAGVLFLAWGLRDAGNMVNSSTVLAVSADVTALEWIKKNTPPDARFYINAATWQGSTYRGVDGGSWLLPYTGRFSLVPPISYAWGTVEYTLQINDWAERAMKLQGCTQEFWDLVDEANLSYVYLRKGKGSLQPDMLANCQRLRQVYNRDGVYIYETRH